MLNKDSSGMLVFFVEYSVSVLIMFNFIHVKQSMCLTYITLEGLLFPLGFLFPPLLELSLKAIHVLWGLTKVKSDDTVSCKGY